MDRTKAKQGADIIIELLDEIKEGKYDNYGVDTEAAKICIRTTYHWLFCISEGLYKNE